MNGQLREWLDGELKEYAELFRAFRRKVTRLVPVWMALSIIAMVALGLGVGYDFAYVARLHLLIGVGIALIIWFGYWIQGRATSMKKVERAYEKAMQDFFIGPDDEDSFCRQMKSGNYGKTSYMNIKLESYPGRFLVGPDYWVFFSGSGRCSLYRTADIERIAAKEERTHFSGGGVSGRMAIGVSLVITYRPGSPSTKGMKGNETSFFFQGGGQCKQVMDLVAQYCPQSQGWRR